MAIGDGSFKFGFSRLGMGLEESRIAETKFKADQAYAKNFKAQERMGRRAYREAARSGNHLQAYEIMRNMSNAGFGVTGTRQAGQLEGMLTQRLDRQEAALTRDGQAPETGVSDPAQPSAFDIARGAVADPAISSKIPTRLMSFAERDAQVNAEAAAKRAASGDQPMGFLQRQVEASSTNPILSAARAETNAISEATAGMSDQGQSRLMEMAGKMGLSGQAAANWMTQMRNTGLERSRQIQTTARVNSAPVQDMADWIDSNAANRKMQSIRESQGKLSDSTRSIIGKNKAQSGLEWLLTQY